MAIETIRGTPEQLAKVPVEWVEEELKASEAQQGYVDVGFFETAKYQDGEYVATIAAIHNFGSQSRNIPPRPFFTHTILGVQRAVEALFDRAGSVKMLQILGEVGQYVENIMKRNVRNGPWQQTAPATIKRKSRYRNTGGTPQPLIDTGYLRQSITHLVRQGQAQ